MKTKKTIFNLFLGLVAVLMFFSCDNPVALGTMLDIQGPVVNIISPSMRQSVPVQFDIEGTAEDYSGVDKLIIKAVKDNVDFPRQWRYQKGAWEVSDNFGATWSPFANGQWSGTTKSVSWKITVDMSIGGQLADDGEYTFNVQAWDKGNFSDDNSFKAVVLIIDLDPPKVDISYPFIYRGKYAYEYAPLKKLHDIGDIDPEWKDPAYLGSFITQEFNLIWQIEDINDVWSIDLRFYDYDTDIDNDVDTPLPDTYIYKYFQNLPPPMHGANPQDYIKPNGSVTVPDLTSPKGTYQGGGEILNPITEKTTIKIVAVCYDAAGNANQEKTLGYFVYWPRANTPWITFSDGMKALDTYTDGVNIGDIEENVFTVYPGRSIKATAFQAHWVKEVKYTLYRCDTSGDKLNKTILTTERTETIIPNPSSNNIFSWDFLVPPRTGYYVLEAQTFSSQGVGSEIYEMLFRVHDITFPDFPEPPKPAASDPLFKVITAGNTFNISGIVGDATEVRSLCLVWINPASKNYAAMSQLAFFREKNYAGWLNALALTPGSGCINYEDYDSAHPNKIWRLNLSYAGTDYETNRQLFSYSQVINLTDLNIGIDYDPEDPSKPFPLKSQIFLLRAENPGGKCTIITYAPQGDTLAPVIEITNVQIQGETYTPNIYALVKKFSVGNTITINGRWAEDSVANLNIQTYFLNKFEITINNQKLNTLTTSNLQPYVPGNVDGTWTITATVGPGNGQISADKLKDTLVIGVSARDIGGNFAEYGCSWLIESDNLRLMRISSENEDKTYKAGDKIRIFLEFSKPVTLANGGAPELILSSAGGDAARAVYEPGQTSQNSRQYFEYTVGATHSTGSSFLNVQGLWSGSAFIPATPYNTDLYPFTWKKGEKGNQEYEEVRITLAANKNGDKEGDYYVRTLPTTTTTGNSDYQYTLTAGKHITIDTAAPTVTNISANTLPGYYNSGSIYMTVTFDKDVIINTDAPPRLSLGGTTGYTDISDVRVSGRTITFKYNILLNNTTSGNAVVITGHTGTITDLAGNLFISTGISGMLVGARTLTGVYIEAQVPIAPSVRVLTAANISNVVENNVNGSIVVGGSYAGATDGVKELGNLYNSALWLAIEPNTTEAYKLKDLEYSINNGGSWIQAPNKTNTPFTISPGEYKIIARQRDEAGNVSPATFAINFIWDSDNLISRISSTTPNGTYTNSAGRNQIDITVYFRKSMRFSGTPRITLNAQRGGPAADIPLTMTPAGGAINSLTFTYIVLLNDAIPGGGFLDVTGISGITAWDGNATGNGVNVSSYLTTAYLPPASPRRLDTNKEFKIETGNLTNTVPAFIADNAGGTGWNTETNANFHGIRTDDGSYWTTLEIPFNRDISKGSGDIIIQQNAGTTAGNTNYRLPAVLTEAQYNRFKGNENTRADIDTYYTKGTNGYIDGIGSDASTKYILRYDVNTAATANAPNAAGTGIPKFADNFRKAETITIPVNAQAVTINGSTLRIRLSGANAPQVPGATYTVTYPVGLVIDTLGNSSVAGNYTTVALRGVAKPFVRIRKTQDTIQINGTTNNSTPRLVATQPFISNARIDCRTPDSVITYAANEYRTVTNAVNWGSGAAQGGNGIDGPQDTAGGATRPGSAVGNNYTIGNEITLGNNAGGTAPTIADVQGYQWWVRARAGVGTNYSTETEEIAYRTVITYKLGGNGITNPTAGQQALGNGDQVWIRGGDAIGSSSVPGFPFTWEDNWNNLEGKRAGIRLMTKTNAADTLNNGTWRLVTWEISITAYIDFIMGRDLAVTEDGIAYTASTANIAWQYGPKRWAYQRAGWTSYKDKSPIYPGKHRWFDTGQNNSNKGDINFSGTFSARSDYTVNSPNPLPGVNTP